MAMRRCVGLVLLLALSLAGCGKSHKIAPVSGRVKLDGNPLAGATLQFIPLAGPDESLPSSVGTTDRDGRYTLVLTGDVKGEGAVVGKHKVFITLGAAGGGSGEGVPTFHKQLPERYNRKTELTWTVPEEGGEANFEDLTSK
jgi:hypothetical protein